MEKYKEDIVEMTKKVSNTMSKKATLGDIHQEYIEAGNDSLRESTIIDEDHDIL